MNLNSFVREIEKIVSNQENESESRKEWSLLQSLQK
jgi:hypothetical protein